MLWGLMPPWMMPASWTLSRARASPQAMVKKSFKRKPGHASASSRVEGDPVEVVLGDEADPVLVAEGDGRDHQGIVQDLEVLDLLPELGFSGTRTGCSPSAP